MVILLALVSAVLFALAAALQQRGQFALAQRGTDVHGAGLAKMVLVPVWLLGTLVLLVGYTTQAVALDQGRLVVIQPLLVTTIVWALPLGHWLTGQHVVRRQIWGAAVVVVGLGLFIVVGDPDAGVDDSSDLSFVIAMLVVGAVVGGLFLVVHRWVREPARRAGLLGVCAGLAFGLSATLAKPVLETLDEGIAAAAEDWRTWALLGIGLGAFVLQQLSLATGQLAPAMAAVSVSNPAISVVLGMWLFDERLTGTGWQIPVAIAALLVALAGAVQITLVNRDTEMPGSAGRGDPAR